MIDLDNSMYGNRLNPQFDPVKFKSKCNQRILNNLNENAVITFNQFIFDIDWQMDEFGNYINIFFPNLWN